MPGDVVKFDYVQIAQMIEQVGKAALRIEETKLLVMKATEAMIHGALQGEAADRLTAAMQMEFLQSIQRLQEKYSMMQQALTAALNDMMEADMKAARNF
jgi:uncharacterized protein YukE